MDFQDVDTIYGLTLRFLSIGIVINSLEFLKIRREFSQNGMFSWLIFKEKRDFLNSYPFIKIGSYLDTIMGQRGIVFILMIRLTAVAGIFYFSVDDTGFFVALTFLIITQMVMNFRLVYGGDGADQMMSIILVSLWLPLTLGSEDFLKTYALYFLAAQACLAYLASGSAKIVSEIWRSGDALAEIMNHDTYGNRFVYGLLDKFPNFSKIACKSVILFQVTFFLYFILPPPVNYLYLVVGVLFHTGIALSMGLIGFFFTFLSTYPALLYLYFIIHSTLN